MNQLQALLKFNVIFMDGTETWVSAENSKQACELAIAQEASHGRNDMLVRRVIPLAMAHKLHNWITVNREVHLPSDIYLADVIEEIRAAFTDKDNHVVKLVELIDQKRYDEAGKVVADVLRQLDKEEGDN